MFSRQVGNYETIEITGESDRATVYRALDKLQNREVALKLLNNKFLYTTSTETRFEKAANKISGLTHYAIVPILGYGDEDNKPYFVMEYMRGGSLRDRFARGALSKDEIIEIFTPIADALDTAASQDIIHNNLKPENILFDENGNPFVSELGMVMVINSISTLKLPNANPNYTSPEQVRNRPMDTTSHVYSLAAMAFEALTGQAVFEGASNMVTMFKHTSERPRDPRRLRPDLPAGVSKVILRGLEKRGENRYPSSRAFVSSLEAALEGAEIPEQDPDPVGMRSSQPQITMEPANIADQDFEDFASFEQPRRSFTGLAITIIAGLIVLGVGCVGAIALIAYGGSTAESVEIRATASVQDTQIVEESMVIAANSAKTAAETWGTTLEERFEDNLNGWEDGPADENRFADISWMIDDARYVWTATAKEGFVWRLWPDMPDMKDFYLSVDAQRISGDVDTQYGLIFRNDESSDNYYFFEVIDSGSFRLMVYFKEEWITLLESEGATPIRSGEMNQLEVVGRGTTFSLYINGEFVGNVIDRTITRGNVGLIIGMFDPGQTAQIVFDNFIVKGPSSPIPQSLDSTPKPLDKPTESIPGTLRPRDE